MGITLALQNHAPVTTPGYEDVLAMLEEIDRPNVKLCLDVPLLTLGVRGRRTNCLALAKELKPRTEFAFEGI